MANISSYFRAFRDQFHKKALQKLYRSNPYQGLVNRSPMDLSEGLAPTINTYTSELPTAYPTALTKWAGTAVAMSTGTNDPQCKLSPTTIKRGQVERQWSLYRAAFRTDTVCVSDLKRSHQAAEAVAAFEKALTNYVTVYWGDLMRLLAINMIDNKVSTTDATFVSPVVSTEGDFSNVAAIPDEELNWAHLDQIYVELVRDGLADEYAVGRTESGRPVIPIVLGPGYVQKLFRNDSDKREQVKYFDPKSNLSVMGYNGAINGFLPIVDMFPIRLGNSTPISTTAGLTTANMIYPTENVATSFIGQKSQLNPLYRPSGIGTGIAQFEVVNILPRNVFELQYEVNDPETVSGMNFEPNDYLGEFDWINNKTFEGDNDLGNKGYYYAQIGVGAKPLFPELGYTILTKCLKF